MALASLHTTRTVKVLAVVIAVGMLGLGIMQAFAVAPGTPEFERTWARTDKPIIDGQADRTWMWGPKANTGVMLERYAESPGEMRQVQYFDKSRMEITNPDSTDDGIWYVTNGLLVNELMSGRVQVGESEYEIREPADEFNVAGDSGDPNSPSYATFATVRGLAPLADDAPIIQRLSRNGVISQDETLADEGVTTAHHVQVTDIDHQVASVFWDFMNSTGVVYEDDAFVDGKLFENPFYATGYPVTEAYWVTARLEGTLQDVLVQCFERRCLTYAPGNEPGWQVEAGNVGMHYYEWRYGDSLAPTATPTTTATATASPSPTQAPDPLPRDRMAFAGLSGVDGSVTGTGVTYFHVQDDGQGIDYQVNLTGVENVTAAYLRMGNVGSGGPILVTFFAAAPGTSALPIDVLASGTIRVSDLPEDMSIADLAEAIMDGDTYVEVLTTTHPGGEVHGPTQPMKYANFRVTLSGEQVIPSVTTNAGGTATFEYNADISTIEYVISLRNVSNMTALYLRAGNVNQNGPIQAALYVDTTPQPDGPEDVTGELTADDLAVSTIDELAFSMLTGKTYLIAHTTAHPAGETRGQVIPEVLIGVPEGAVENTVLLPTSHSE